MPNYRLRFEPDDNGTMLVSSPDIPLVTFGADRADAARHASAAATAILRSLMDAGEAIPPGVDRVEGDATLVVLPDAVLAEVEAYRAPR